MKTLLKFYASWCKPCAALSTVLETIDTNSMSIDIYEIDVDKLPKVAAAHNIRSLPTLILIEDNDPATETRCTGVKTKEQLLQFLGSN